MGSNPNWLTIDKALAFRNANAQRDLYQQQVDAQTLAAQAKIVDQAKQYQAIGQLPTAVQPYIQSGVVDKSNFLPFYNQQQAEGVAAGHDPTKAFSPLELLRTTQGLGGDPTKTQGYLDLMANQAAGEMHQNPKIRAVFTDAQKQLETKMAETMQGRDGTLLAVQMFGKPLGQLNQDEKRQLVGEVHNRTFAGIEESALSGLMDADPAAAQALIQIKFSNPAVYSRILEGMSAKSQDLYKDAATVEASRMNATSQAAYREAQLGQMGVENQFKATQLGLQTSGNAREDAKFQAEQQKADEARRARLARGQSLLQRFPNAVSNTALSDADRAAAAEYEAFAAVNRPAPQAAPAPAPAAKPTLRTSSKSTAGKLTPAQEALMKRLDALGGRQ